MIGQKVHEVLFVYYRKDINYCPKCCHVNVDGNGRKVATACRLWRPNGSLRKRAPGSHQACLTSITIKLIRRFLYNQGSILVVIGFSMYESCVFAASLHQNTQSTRDHGGCDAWRCLFASFVPFFSFQLRWESTSRTNRKRSRPTETAVWHRTGITQCLVHLGLPTGATNRLHFPFRHLLPKKIPLRAVVVGPFLP